DGSSTFNKKINMTQKIIKSSGWVLTIILALLFSFSAFLKLSQDEAALAQATSVGLDPGTYQFIGLVEIFSVVLFVIPRTGVLGALLLIAYMGGAIVTHLEHQQPIFVALVVQILVWITVALRFPETTQRLFSGTIKTA
ncbi:MAG: DoxX family protein, partial [Cyclobacteriaceae bacterium]|nr:DoxX family protein [Cyclobacteriaceae bacterium]